MYKRRLLVFSMIVILGLILVGCSSTPEYIPPDPGTPQAWGQFTNDCDFAIRLYIDGQDAGYIYRNETKTFPVTPGVHTFDFSGYDSDLSYGDDIPVYFSTRYTFKNNETYTLQLRFGVY